MPTLMIHHRKRLVLKKLTSYVKWKRQMIASLALNQIPMINEYEQDDEEIQMPPGADLPFDRIPFMSKQERQQLKNEFSNLPPYMFMTEKQKRSFFKQRSQQYNKKLLGAPQRKSKTKKIVKFDKVFDVRPFRENEAVVQVKKTKSFKDSYQNYHFS